MKKNYKNFSQSKKTFNKSNQNKKCSSLRGSSRGTCVFIGNVITKELKNTEINKLINSFLNSSPSYQNSFVTSVQVFNDYLYIYFQNKSDALNASKFYDNYNFKNFKLQSYVLNSIDLNESVDESNEEENQVDYDTNSSYRQNQIECEILVSNLQIKKYADTINDRLQKSLFGINTLIKYSNYDSNEELLLTKDILKDAFDRNLLYLIYINQENEQYNSLNLIIFNKWRLLKYENTNHTIKENKNIPSNKAFDILKSDFRDYLENVKEFYANTNFNNSKTNTKDVTKSNDSVIDKDLMDNIFTKMIDLPTIEIKDLDFLTSYLNGQKNKLISKLKIECKTQNNNSSNVNQSSHQPNSIPQQNKQPQSKQSNNQQNFQQQIPSLLSQPMFFQPNLMQQSTNFMPNMGNRNNQLQSLMSITNPSQVCQTQVPSLMNIQTNYNTGTQNYNKNYNNYK